MNEKYDDSIALLRKEIRARDLDIQKAATFGNQLLEEKEKLSEHLHQILSENDDLKQEKYSLQLDLETQIQTVYTQSSELELRNDQYDDIKRKLELLQKESISQKQQINNLTNEKEDLEKSLQESHHESCQLKKKVAFQQQQIQDLQQKAENNLNISWPRILEEENDINYYKLQNKQLQEAISEIQFELKSAKLESNQLSSLVKVLEEGVQERDKEIKSFSVEVKNSREFATELQCEVEMLKLEQLDVNRRGNSVFGELDDRRKYVEKEYKLLEKKYDNMLTNYDNNKKELSNCRGQMAMLLSMTSRSYQIAYINELEGNLMDAKREISSLTAKLSMLVKSHNQQQLSLEQMPKSGDEYAYLRVLYDQAEKKVNILENELVTLRMQNMADNNSLTNTQQHMYRAQEDLDAKRLEIMRLKQELQDLTVKPDAATPVKCKQNIEILPGYNYSPATVKKMQSEMENKYKPNEDIIPGELAMIDGEFREVKPPRRSNKSILRSLNKIGKDEIVSSLQESDEVPTEIKYLKDDSMNENHSNERVKPSYAKYKPSSFKNKNEACAHQ